MLEVGKEYTVRHQRKGTFRMRIVSEGKTWVTGVVTKGGAYSHAGRCGVGDEIVVRESLAHFEIVEHESQVDE